MVEARSEKENERWETIQHMLAWHASNIMTATSGKKVTPDKLLGKKQKENKESKKITDIQKRKYEVRKQELLERLNSKNRG
ncbi:hypothetical protein SAMN05444392_102271 [Seinonella peptonophila]|uniref:Uncharacterized protein n=1 Tax=Seinonella peptonophila TaxID=112248 RepID=A0A1M4VBE6_9BACL|nr:hypothetical protein SAMN05444392_102271 [Seinonella peptonophila]